MAEKIITAYSKHSRGWRLRRVSALPVLLRWDRPAHRVCRPSHACGTLRFRRTSRILLLQFHFPVPRSIEAHSGAMMKMWADRIIASIERLILVRCESRWHFQCTGDGRGSEAGSLEARPLSLVVASKIGNACDTLVTVIDHH